MASDNYDPVPDLAALVISALYGRHDVLCHAEKVASGCGFDEEATPEAVAGALREALGIPGPRTVTYDMNDLDRYTALTGALDEYAAAQRDMARRGNGRAPWRLRQAEAADQMRSRAHEAFSAPRRQAGGVAGGDG